MPPALRVADRVVDQVHHDLAQRQRVCRRPPSTPVPACSNPRSMSLALRLTGQVLEHVADHDVDGDCRASAGSARSCASAADSVSSWLTSRIDCWTVSADGGQRFLASGAVVRAQRVADLRRQQRQRRAQLVRGVLDEDALRAGVLIEAARVLVDRLDERSQLHRHRPRTTAAAANRARGPRTVSRKRSSGMQALAQAEQHQQRDQRQQQQLLRPSSAARACAPARRGPAWSAPTCTRTGCDAGLGRAPAAGRPPRAPARRARRVSKNDRRLRLQA